MTRAPSRFAAVSNESRVRVLGSKNKVATMRPSRSLRLGRSFEFVRHLHEIQDFLARRFAILTKLLFVVMSVLVLEIALRPQIYAFLRGIPSPRHKKYHLFRSSSISKVR